MAELTREALLRDLASDDEARVVAALHRACPCTGSPVLYEELLPLLHRLKKDPRPNVRAVAIHLEIDALQQLNIEDETAAGWVRNRPGGNGRRRETKRAAVRYGLR